MAAFRLGVGDVFTLCKSAIDICTTLPHQPTHKETSTIIAEMKAMRTHLETLHNGMEDELRGSNPRADIAPIVKRSLKPVCRDLTELKELMKQHHELVNGQEDGTRKQSVHVLDQARYLMLYKAKLRTFQDRMEKHRESVCIVKGLMVQEDMSATQRRMSVLRLNEIREGHERDEVERRKSKEDMEMLSFMAEHYEQAEQDKDVLGELPNPQHERVSSEQRPLRHQTPLFKMDIFDRKMGSAHIDPILTRQLSTTLSPSEDETELLTPD